MGSLHICHTARANIQQTKAIFLPFKASTHIKLGKPSLDFKLTHNTCGIVHAKSMEPYISSSCTTHQFPLSIGIIGLGDFGQFLAKAFRRQGHSVLGTSRSDYSEFCETHDITFFRDLNDICEAQPEVLLLCNSISSTEDIVNKIPFHKLKPDTIIADVLSVKEFPKKLLLDVVPSGFGILCTHPMFGKFSGKNSWEGLRFVYDRVRLEANSIQQQKCERFLDIFRDEGCQMVEMSCEEHDRYAAASQFITHTVARILSHMNLESTPMDTKGYETLLQLTKNTSSFSNDLYEGLFMYNVNAAEQIEKLDRAFEKVKERLYRRVREKLKKNIEGNVVELGETSKTSHSPQSVESSDSVEELSSYSWIQNEGNQDPSTEQRNEVHHATL